MRFARLAPLVLLGCGGDVQRVRVTANTDSVVVDGADAYSIVFETNPTCTASEAFTCGSVRRWNRARGDSVVLARVNGIGGWLAIDADAVYFTTSTGWNTGEAEQGPTDRTTATIARVPKTGGAVTTLATLPHASVSGLVVRGGRVLFLAGSVGQGSASGLWAVPTDGGDVSVVAPAVGDAALVADDTAIYWANRASGNPEGFSIFSLPLAAGGTPKVFATGGEGWVEAMALDADTLWVSNHGAIPTSPGADPTGGTVTAYTRAYGTPRTIASGLNTAGALAVDDTRVVYVVKGEVRASPKTGNAASVTLIESFDGSSVAADGAGVCVAATYDAQVACIPR
jgi:hypothetical protein